MKKILITILALLISASSFGQSYTDIIRQIAQRSLELKAYRAQFTVDSLDQRRGLNPDDPEIDMEYSLDRNASISLSQTFDFPTVYAQRGKLSKLGIARADVNLRSSSRDLMIQISDKYIELIYHTKLVQLLSDRADRLSEYVAKVERGTSIGEYTVLDLDGARTLSAQMQSELIRAKSELAQCGNTLAQWGGFPSTDTPVAYPVFEAVTMAEFLDKAISNDLALEAVKIDSLIAQRTLKLSRNEWLPRFKVGYKAELPSEGSTRGAILAGLSVPLWQNRGIVKHGKALVKSSEAQNAATTKSVTTALENLYTAYQASSESVKVHPSDNRPYIDLLKKSLANGAITSSEFLLSVYDRYEVQQKYLEIEMENIKNRAMIEILMN